MDERGSGCPGASCGLAKCVIEDLPSIRIEPELDVGNEVFVNIL